MKPFAVCILLALAVFAGYGWGQRQAVEGGSPADTVTVLPAAYEARLADLVIENTGLRARLEGVRTLSPDTVFRVDTLVRADTVFRFVSVDSRGRLAVELLARPDTIPADMPYGMQPELRVGYDVSECDEGFSLEGGSVTCDRSRLGHLWVGVEASRRPSLTAWWNPSYRSPWEVGASYDGSRFDFSVRRGVRIW